MSRPSFPYLLYTGGQIKTRRWARHVEGIRERRWAYRILAEKPEGNKSLGRPRC
jgi:hypothetical protein